MLSHKVTITYANPNRLSEILIEISIFAHSKKSQSAFPDACLSGCSVQICAIMCSLLHWLMTFASSSKPVFCLMLVGNENNYK